MKPETAAKEMKTPPRLHFSLEPDPARLARARERIRDYLSRYCGDPRVVKEMVLCIDEACTNTMRHSGSRGAIEIHAGFEGDKLVATVIDHGRGFDVSSFDPSATPDLDRDCGRGLFLIATLTDELELRSEDGLQVLMRKTCTLCRNDGGFETGFDVRTAHDGRLARTQAMLEEIDEAFVAIDWDYRVIYANGVARRLAAGRAGDTAGMPLSELFPDFDESVAGRAIREAMELGQAGIVQYEGLAGWSEGRIFPTSAGVSLFVRDINAHKRLEEERERFSDLLHLSHDAIVVWPLNGGIEVWNRGAEQLYGYTEAEALGQVTHDLLCTGFPEPWPRIEEALRTDGGWEGQFTHRAKDGRRIVVSTRLQLVLARDGAELVLETNRDITEKTRVRRERERLLDELRTSSERAGFLADVIERADVAYGVGTPDGRLLLFNQAFANLTGYSREELEGMALTWVTDLTPEEWREREARLLREAVSDRRSVRYEKEYVRKDGSRVPIELFVQPEFDGSGELLRYRSFVTDISKRKRAERALRESERRYRDLFSNMAEEVHYWELVRDESGAIKTWKLVDANAPALRTWGRASVDEIRGKTTDEIFGPGSTEHYMPVVEKITREGQPYSYEDYFPQLDRYFRFTSVPLGENFITTGADITDAKRSERAIRESEQKYRTIVETTAEGVLIGLPDGTITYVNQQMADMLGHTAEELVGMAGLELVFPDAEPQVMDNRTSLSAGEVLRGEIKLRRKDGEALWSLFSSTPLFDRSGTHIANLTMHSDITERKRAEDLLLQKNEELGEAIAQRQLALDAANLGWWHYDPASDTSWYDEGYRKIFEVSGSEKPNEEILKRLHPDDLPGVWAKVEAALDPVDPKPYSAEYRVLIPDGSIRWVEAHGIATFDGEGADRHAVSLVGTVQDVTERVAGAAERQRMLEEAQALTEEMQAQNEELVTQTEELMQARDLIGAELARSSLLQEVGQAAAAGLEPRAIAEQTLASLRNHLQLKGGDVRIIDGDRLQLLAWFNYPEETLAVIHDVDMTGSQLLGAEAVRLQRTLTQDDESLTPDRRRLLASHEVEGDRYVYVPIGHRGRVLGILSLTFEGRRSFTGEELSLFTSIADTLGQAFANASLFEAQRRVALTLQQNLRHAPPDLPALEIGLVEAPAVDPGLVGGDFWDVHELPDRRVLVVIGDVAGKGIAAAGLTETVRSTMRAFAHVDPTPGFILRKTSEMLLADGDDHFVTALALVIDPASGRVTYASAGHPGPVRISPAGCSILDPLYGPPLGTFATEYRSGELMLPEEESLLLYTDGVTEARRDHKLFGERSLVELGCALLEARAQEIAERVREAAQSYADQVLMDDLEVLVLRRERTKPPSELA